MSNYQSWLSVIDTLANNDITKHNTVLDLNYIHCLNTLEIYKIKSKMEQEYLDNINKK